MRNPGLSPDVTWVSRGFRNLFDRHLGFLGPDTDAPLVPFSKVFDYNLHFAMKPEVESGTLSVVMPAYNEEATLAEIVGQVLRIPQLKELIIVDDCSGDRTPEIAGDLANGDPRVRYIRQARNGGKTEALKRGFELSTGDIVIIQDADLEYDPTEIADVIAPIIEGHADVVYGSRFMVKRAARVIYFYHYLANKGLTFLSNMLTNLNMTDVETCYKAFRGEIIRNMVITSSGFGFEIEVTAKIAKLRCAVYEVPISYYGRTYEEGKKIGFRDGVAALWYIAKYNILVGLSGSYKELPKSLAAAPKQIRE